MGTLPIPQAWGRGPVTDSKGNPTPQFMRWLQDHETMVRSVLAINGKTAQIQAAAPVAGRSEGLGTTVKNLTPTGAFNSLGNVQNTLTDFLTDGTGNPLTGGKRGFQALDTNNRLVNSFRATGVNVSSTPTSSTVLSNTGAATLISIAGSSNQFAPGLVSYNSGSVDPGSFGGPNYITASDPTFAGGAVPYSTSLNVQQQTAAEGNVSLGGITTVNGTAKTGGGFSGGTGGSRGGRGFQQ